MQRKKIIVGWGQHYAYIETQILKVGKTPSMQKSTNAWWQIDSIIQRWAHIIMDVLDTLNNLSTLNWT